MLDVPVIEQVIAVPKISFDRVLQRSALPVPQTAEQLVEVSTNRGTRSPVVASKLCSRREIRRILSGLGSTVSGFGQIVNNPVPKVVEGVMHVEVFKVLVLDRIQQRIWSRSLKFLFLRVAGKWRRSSRFSPSTEFSSGCEQIVDSLARRGLSDFLQGQGSSSSSSSRLRDDADEAFTGFFSALFPFKKNRCWARTRGRNCSPSRAHPRGRAYEDRDAPG